MRLPLNLATEPMRRDRPILVASAALGIVLCVTLIALIGLMVTDRRNMDESHRIIGQVEKQMARVNAAQAQIDAQMRIPENASQLYRSELFNSLIRSKAISWTRIFSDLATVLPPNVRVVSIRPQLNAKNELTLEMVVAATAPEQIIGFVNKLEDSDLFGDVTNPSQISPTQNDPFFRSMLTVTYDQKL